MHLNLNLDSTKSQNLNKLKIICRGNALSVYAVKSILHLKTKEVPENV